MEDTIDVKSILDLLQRQLKLIAATTTVVVALALAYLFSVTPTYTSTALILVDPAQKNLLDSQAGGPSNANADNARIESEVEILRSSSIALEVINRARLITDPEFGPTIGLRGRIAAAVGLGGDQNVEGEVLLQQTLNKLNNAVSVRRRGLTYLISLSITSEDPNRSAELANIMADTYIGSQIEAKISSSLAARDILQAQIDAGRQSVARSDSAVDRFIDNNLAALEADASRPELARLKALLENAEQQRLSIEVATERASASLQEQNWDTLANQLGDQALQDLQRERTSVQQRLAGISAGSSLEVDLRASLDALDTSISNRAETAVSGLRSELSALNSQASTYRADLREELLSGDLSSESLAQIYELQQEAAIARTQYQSLLSSLRDLETQAVLQVADSRVVSAALAPTSPSAPKGRLIVAVALVLGLGLGIALAFTTEYYVGGVTSVAQLRDLLHTDVSTTVPLSHDRNDERLTIADKVVLEPLSPYAESIRRLRAAIDQRFRKSGRISTLPGAQNQGVVIMVTSTIPAEGKSTTALALGRTFALSGKKTLLIDADLRKPSIHRQVGIQPEHGLIDYLRDPESSEISSSFYTRDPQSNMTLVLGAGRSNVPTDQMLSSRTFDTMLNDSRAAFDVVIIDTSPLAPVVDARYIAHHADAVVMMVRWATTNQGDLRQAVNGVREAMSPDTDFHTALSHQQYRQASYRYDGYYSGYGAESDD